jgi:hypothetical protein
MTHKRPSIRSIEMGNARIAGYHDDARLWVRTVVERKRTSYTVLQEQYQVGVKMKRQGVKCNCYTCKEVTP